MSSTSSKPTSSIENIAPAELDVSVYILVHVIEQAVYVNAFLTIPDALKMAYHTMLEDLEPPYNTSIAKEIPRLIKENGEPKKIFHYFNQHQRDEWMRIDECCVNGETVNIYGDQ